MAAGKSASVITGTETVFKTGDATTVLKTGAVSAVLKMGAASPVLRTGAVSTDLKTGTSSAVQKTGMKSAKVVLKWCSREDCLLNVAKVSHGFEDTGEVNSVPVQKRFEGALPGREKLPRGPNTK